MKPTILLSLTALFVASGIVTVPAQSGPRSSSNYETATESVDAGGSRAVSANYSQEGSLGGITGLSTVMTPPEVAKHGYLGQLYEVNGLTLSANPTTMPEGGTRQIEAEANLDDLTTLSLPGTDVSWSVLQGPLNGIDPSGLATATAVYTDSLAQVGGSYQGASGEAWLIVLETIADNYEEYGGDGVNDAWQVNYFGEPPNADAGPDQDPDNDDQNNEFESLTGFDPTDGNDFLRFELVGRTGTTATLGLSKVVPGTIYTVRQSTDLGETDPFESFPGSTFSVTEESADYELPDNAATESEKFYILEVTGDAP